MDLSNLDGGVTWRIPAGKPLKWRRWDEASVVIDLDSGQTHYLNLFSMVALEHLEKEAVTTDQLARNIADYLDIPLDENLAGQVSGLIKQFDELGLIEPCRI